MDLLIFYGILKDKAVQAVLENNYAKALRYIIDFAEKKSVTKMAAKEYFIHLLINEESVLSSLAEQDLKIGNDLYRAALTDMTEIFNTLIEAPINYEPSGNRVNFSRMCVEKTEELANAKKPKELLDGLIDYYKTLGSGELSRYSAFKFSGELSGVEEDESVTLSSLVGLEYQKNILISNTKAFVKGNAANNVLLFGDRGTGKSSSVKAILNEFKSEGLRMIEVPKQNIGDIPSLITFLSEKPNKYILFLDDLTFETHDKEYRALKIAMDGQLACHPDNVLIYATSNRRHLIKETWADRDGEDVHVNDNMQENLSLSERFGISLVFASPNQGEYLKIVKELLLRHGVEMNAEIEKKAVVWQMNYGGRNPRMAKQFVKDYVAEKL